VTILIDEIIYMTDLCWQFPLCI